MINDADGLVGKINRETNCFATKRGNAVVVYEVAVSTRKAEEIQSNPIDWIDPAEYGYQFSRMEGDRKAVYLPLS